MTLYDDVTIGLRHVRHVTRCNPIVRVTFVNVVVAFSTVQATFVHCPLRTTPVS